MSHEFEQVYAAVRERFARVARAPESETKFPVGARSAKALGYDPVEIDALPSVVTESFAGVGNPLSLGELSSGQIVVDLGCGGGLDSILAARRLGLTGSVVGLDMTAEMVQKARQNVASLGLSNVEFRHALLENMPLADGVADVAISNGVLNLCPNKLRVLNEVWRILRPGGRLLMADILLEEHVTPEEVAEKGEWSD